MQCLSSLCLAHAVTSNGLDHAGKAVLLSVDVSGKGEVAVAQPDSQVQFLGHDLT